MIPEYRRGVDLVGLDADYLREQRRRAVLSVCARAADAEDADFLLGSLGLRPHEARPTTEENYVGDDPVVHG